MNIIKNVLLLGNMHITPTNHSLHYLNWYYCSPCWTTNNSPSIDYPSWNQTTVLSDLNEKSRATRFGGILTNPFVFFFFFFFSFHGLDKKTGPRKLKWENDKSKSDGYITVFAKMRKILVEIQARGIEPSKQIHNKCCFLKIKFPNSVTCQNSFQRWKTH